LEPSSTILRIINVSAVAAGDYIQKLISTSPYICDISGNVNDFPEPISKLEVSIWGTPTPVLYINLKLSLSYK